MQTKEEDDEQSNLWHEDLDVLAKNLRLRVASDLLGGTVSILQDALFVNNAG